MTGCYRLGAVLATIWTLSVSDITTVVSGIFLIRAVFVYLVIRRVPWQHWAASSKSLGHRAVSQAEAAHKLRLLDGAFKGRCQSAASGSLRVWSKPSVTIFKSRVASYAHTSSSQNDRIRSCHHVVCWGCVTTNTMFRLVKLSTRSYLPMTGLAWMWPKVRVNTFRIFQRDAFFQVIRSKCRGSFFCWGIKITSLLPFLL